MSKRDAGAERSDGRSSEELMSAYQLGDEEAFTLLYRRHSGRVYGFLVARLRNPEWARDVFQMTFMKLHAARSRYNPSLPFVPWLFTVCRSVMIDSLRSRGRSLEDLNPEALELAAVSGSSGESVAHGEAAVDASALASLPEAQRRAIELRYGEDLEFEEIARKLKTSPANVRQLVSRAVRRLRLVLATREGGPDER